MQLTLYTDYALRTLIYLGLHPEGGTITTIAERYGISRNHLVKVAHNLGQLGYIHTTRGKSGGLSLAREPERISLGEVVRATEHSLNLVECFDAKTNRCPISGVCRLQNVLHDAQRAFLAVLDAHTLKDVLANPEALLRSLGTKAKSRRPAPSIRAQK